MIEGSGSIPVPLTSGSGSGRPKNTWIRWIRNTGCDSVSQVRYLFTITFALENVRLKGWRKPGYTYVGKSSFKGTVQGADDKLGQFLDQVIK